MPARGTTYKTGKRDLIIDQKFYKQFLKDTNIDIDYKTFREVILESNKEIANLVINAEDGFKLPENMGYIVVTKYKSKNPHPVDWKNSKKLKKEVLLTNLHSFGYMYHIKWFRKGLASFAFKDVFRLEPTRLLKRGVAKAIKEGKDYNSWSTSDFWSTTKTLRKIYTKN